MPRSRGMTYSARLLTLVRVLMRQRLLTLTCLLVTLCVGVRADEEASNVPHVAVDQYGRCYAKSVPAESYGSKGETNVYAVDRQDRLVETYAWYSGQVYLQCFTPMPDRQVAISVVQFGPWARGRKANDDDLALAFYARGKLLRRYSTLDIAGSPDRISNSVSHYTVISRVEGYVQVRRLEGIVRSASESAFAVVTVDGRRLLFDPATGDIIASVDGEPSGR